MPIEHNFYASIRFSDEQESPWNSYKVLESNPTLGRFEGETPVCDEPLPSAGK